MMKKLTSSASLPVPKWYVRAGKLVARPCRYLPNYVIQAGGQGQGGHREERGGLHEY